MHAQIWCGGEGKAVVTSNGGDVEVGAACGWDRPAATLMCTPRAWRAGPPAAAGCRCAAGRPPGSPRRRLHKPPDAAWPPRAASTRCRGGALQPKRRPRACAAGKRRRGVHADHPRPARDTGAAGSRLRASTSGHAAHCLRAPPAADPRRASCPWRPPTTWSMSRRSTANQWPQCGGRLGWSNGGGCPPQRPDEHFPDSRRGISRRVVVLAQPQLSGSESARA